MKAKEPMLLLNKVVMKYLFLFFVFSCSLNSMFGYFYEIPSITQMKWIKFVGTIEIFDIKGDNEEPIENTKTISNITSISSLSDDRCILSFNPFMTRIRKIDGTTKESLFSKVSYVFDGINWKQYFYESSISNSEEIKKENRLLVSSKSPLELDEFMDIYSGRIFLFWKFPFFEASKETVTILDVLMEKRVFPPYKINIKDNEMTIYSETASNIYQADLILENKSPSMMTRYINTYKRINNEPKLKIEFVFKGKKDIGSNMLSIPTCVERTMFDYRDKKGFKIIVTLNKFDFLDKFDFSKEQPKAKQGWYVIDKNKGIIYRNAGNKDEILKSLKTL